MKYTLLLLVFVFASCTKYVYIPEENTNNNNPAVESYSTSNTTLLNVKDFGAKGDGVTDDTEAFRKAAKTRRALFIPATDKAYLISDTLHFYADVIGEHMAKTKLIYTGTGWAITMQGGSNFGVSISNLSIHSNRERTNKKVNQNGIRIWGATHNRIQSIRTIGLDGIHIQLGNQDYKAGSYWGRFSEIFCILWPDQTGKTGIHISGQENLIPGRKKEPRSINSNANIFENTVVSGLFETMVYVGGNNNKIIGGTMQWDKDGDQTKHVYYVNGSGNLISTPYIEMADNKIPNNIIYLGPNSRNNRFDNIHSMFVVETSYDAKIKDLGAGNTVDIPNTIFGFTPNIDLSQNLIENSDFNLLSKANLPYGWVSRSKNISYQKRNAVESKGLIAMKSKNSFDKISYDLIEGDNSISNYKKETFAGKTIAFSIYAKTNIKNGGQLSISCKSANKKYSGIFGRATHSGSGEWELLTAVFKIPEDIEQITLVAASAYESKTKNTGTILFKDPVASFGGKTKNNNNRYLKDSGGDIYGDIKIINGEIIRYSSKGEAFKLSFPDGEGPAVWKKTNKD